MSRPTVLPATDFSDLLGRRVPVVAAPSGDATEVQGVGWDANGEPVEVWATFATVWAKVIDISGREFVLSGGVQNQVQTKILIRYLSGVLPTMRIIDGSQIYGVEAVLEQGGRSQLLMCSRL